MKADLGTLANLIKHGDVLIELLRGGNTPQTYGKVKETLADPQAMGRLMGALDGMEQNLRVLKFVEIAVKAEQ